jgi:hypothetical protein
LLLVAWLEFWFGLLFQRNIPISFSMLVLVAIFLLELIFVLISFLGNQEGYLPSQQFVTGAVSSVQIDTLNVYMHSSFIESSFSFSEEFGASFGVSAELPFKIGLFSTSVYYRNTIKKMFSSSSSLFIRTAKIIFLGKTTQITDTELISEIKRAAEALPPFSESNLHPYTTFFYQYPTYYVESVTYGGLWQDMYMILSQVNSKMDSTSINAGIQRSLHLKLGG